MWDVADFGDVSNTTLFVHVWKSWRIKNNQQQSFLGQWAMKLNLFTGVKAVPTDHLPSNFKDKHKIIALKCPVLSLFNHYK